MANIMKKKELKKQKAKLIKEKLLVLSLNDDVKKNRVIYLLNVIIG